MLFDEDDDEMENPQKNILVAAEKIDKKSTNLNEKLNDLLKNEEKEDNEDLIFTNIKTKNEIIKNDLDVNKNNKKTKKSEKALGLFTYEEEENEKTQESNFNKNQENLKKKELFIQDKIKSENIFEDIFSIKEKENVDNNKLAENTIINKKEKLLFFEESEKQEEIKINNNNFSNPSNVFSEIFSNNTSKKENNEELNKMKLKSKKNLDFLLDFNAEEEINTENKNKANKENEININILTEILDNQSSKNLTNNPLKDLNFNVNCLEQENKNLENNNENLNLIDKENIFLKSQKKEENNETINSNIINILEDKNNKNENQNIETILNKEIDNDSKNNYLESNLENSNEIKEDKENIKHNHENKTNTVIKLQENNQNNRETEKINIAIDTNNKENIHENEISKEKPISEDSDISKPIRKNNTLLSATENIPSLDSNKFSLAKPKISFEDIESEENINSKFNNQKISNNNNKPKKLAINFNDPLRPVKKNNSNKKPEKNENKEKIIINKNKTNTNSHKTKNIFEDSEEEKEKFSEEIVVKHAIDESKILLDETQNEEKVEQIAKVNMISNEDKNNENGLKENTNEENQLVKEKETEQLISAIEIKPEEKRKSIKINKFSEIQKVNYFF